MKNSYTVIARQCKKKINITAASVCHPVGVIVGVLTCFFLKQQLPTATIDWHIPAEVQELVH